MGTGELLGQPDRMLGSTLRWTSIPSRAGSNIPSRFMLQKPELGAKSYEPVLLERLYFTFSYHVYYKFLQL